MGTALVLATSGLLVIAVLVAVLLKALPPLPSPQLWMHYLALRQRARALALFKEKGKEGANQSRPSRQELLGLFYLNPIPAIPRLVSAVKNHHLVVLATIAERMEPSSECDALEIIEAFLQDRSQLLRSSLEIDEQLSELRKNPAKKEWAIKEFERKSEQVQEKLKNNLKGICLKLDDLLAACRPSEADEPVVYH